MSRVDVIGVSVRHASFFFVVGGNPFDETAEWLFRLRANAVTYVLLNLVSTWLIIATWERKKFDHDSVETDPWTKSYSLSYETCWIAGERNCFVKFFSILHSFVVHYYSIILQDKRTFSDEQIIVLLYYLGLSILLFANSLCVCIIMSVIILKSEFGKYLFIS